MNAPLASLHALQPEAITLDDKYTLERGRVFLTGTQALIRLPMLQRQRDVKAGLNTRVHQWLSWLPAWQRRPDRRQSTKISRGAPCALPARCQ